MKCENCGREFEPGNDNSGIPNGLTFEFQNGRTLTLCSACIMRDYKRIIKNAMKNSEAQND